MIRKGSKVYSILHGVCPRCQEGRMFRFVPYKNLDFSSMHEHCSVCGLAFEPEPDFYQGAIYVSYGRTHPLTPPRRGVRPTSGANVLFV